jgi:rubrerythrin
MSAGKGDTPRPVAGEAYRSNWEAIFRKPEEGSLSDILTKVREQFPYPSWICRPCGFAYGRFPSQDRVSTYHQDTCDICGEVTACSEPRDFGHLRKWPL